MTNVCNCLIQVLCSGCLLYYSDSFSVCTRILQRRGEPWTKSHFYTTVHTVTGILNGKLEFPWGDAFWTAKFPRVRRWVAQDECWWSQSRESNRGLTYKKAAKNKVQRGEEKKYQSKTRVQEVCTENHCSQLELAPHLPPHPPSGCGLLHCTERSDCCSSGS